MTSGQHRAINELKRLVMSDPGRFEILEGPELVGDKLRTVISLRIGLLALAEDGLDLREREDFILIVPPEFPFDKPYIKLDHDRFAGFPHVVWKRQLCLYQSTAEWNPADGLYGFIDRLLLWLEKAAINDMDPYDGPLEPPHHSTDFSQLPFVVREDTPFNAGEGWFGLAELEKFDNRVEIVGWNDLTTEWPKIPAMVIALKDAIPIEFPTKGGELFSELEKQGIDKQKILFNLRIASAFTPKDDPAYIVLAMPMRRSPDGEDKHHIAIWAIHPTIAESMRLAAPYDRDSEELSTLKDELNNKVYEVVKDSPISWCQVLEDRNEIVVRRDVGTPMAWFKGKKILIAGCGALGSWAAEFIARSCPELIHLVDNSVVKPGILSRQNFCLEDIAKNKAKALESRLKKIVTPTIIEGFNKDAHQFVIEDIDRFKDYDLFLDFTASNIFQMKLERDWQMFDSQAPRFGAMVINGNAEKCLGIASHRGSLEGVWGTFMRLKNTVCFDAGHKNIVDDFYNTEKASEMLFQPEPGCSDPTYVGSCADIVSLVSVGLDHIVKSAINVSAKDGLVFSANDNKISKFKLSGFVEVAVGHYRVRVCKSVFSESSAWVKQNNRIRTQRHETGGLLWGLWDDSINVIWIFDVSGPPSDSSHEPAHFVCGVNGTAEEHEKRMALSFGSNGFVGLWHTHPNMSSRQSMTDVSQMTDLVSSKIGHNKKRSVMLIFGRSAGAPSAGIYIYENIGLEESTEEIGVYESQLVLEKSVV